MDSFGERPEGKRLLSRPRGKRKANRSIKIHLKTR
jgi:hypothetical protein